MNVSFNTYSPQQQYSNKLANNKKQQQYNAPAFGGSVDRIAESVTRKSNFMKSFWTKTGKKYDEFGEWLAQNVLPKVFDNKTTDKFSDMVKDSDLLFNHFLAVGSAITSGMYMYKTLTMDEKKVDKDRKRTLAVNQFLTFVLSTAGAYTLDKSLSNWWQNMTVRYASGQCNDKNFDLLKQFKDDVAKAKADNIEIIKSNNALKAAAKKEGRKIVKAELQDLKSVKAEKFLEKQVGKYLGTPKDAEKLLNKVKGMGYLKTMLVFALVYRYIVPVAVTKPANILCDKYLAHKKSKEAEKAKAENV